MPCQEFSIKSDIKSIMLSLRVLSILLVDISIIGRIYFGTFFLELDREVCHKPVDFNSTFSTANSSRLVKCLLSCSKSGPAVSYTQVSPFWKHSNLKTICIHFHGKFGAVMRLFIIQAIKSTSSYTPVSMQTYINEHGHTELLKQIHTCVSFMINLYIFNRNFYTHSPKMYTQI